jgi:uncharacterized Zn-binding protein involved in type VI secretion
MVDVKPHVGGPIMPPGLPTVLIGGMPAARVGDLATCVGPPDVIAKGSFGVLIGGPGAARLSDITAHGGAITVGLPTVLIGEAAPGPLSPEMAAALFKLMAAQGDIAFKYPTDGCYARNWLMVQRMQQLGIQPYVAWSVGDLHAKTSNHPKGYVEWAYHVAPLVEVRQPDGKIDVMVIDPSLSDRPMTVDEWKNAQKKNASDPDPALVFKKPGEPPGTKGSGYWPSDDPKEGPDDHAKRKMKEYKKKEGTDK